MNEEKNEAKKENRNVERKEMNEVTNE